MPDVLSQDNDVLSSFFTPSSPMMTTPPSEPPPAAPATNLQPQIDALRRRSDAAIGGVERTMAEQEQTAAEKEKAMEPLRQRQMALADRNLKQLEQPPPKAQQPPATPQRQNQHDDENWLFAASILGALAGGLTRRHMTNALGAFSGAMEGYQEGSRQKFDQNMKIWEAENKKIQETNKAAMDEYRSVLENTKLSQDQMSIALRLAAAKYDDKAMAESAKSKNFFQIAQHYDKEAQALQTLEESHNKLSEQHQLARERETNRLAIAQMRSLGVKPEQADDYIKGIASYDIEPPHGVRAASVMNLVKQVNPEWNEATWIDRKIRAGIPARAEAAGATAAARTLNTAGANVEIVLSRAGPVLTNAAEAANRVPATEFKRINQLYQTAAEEISDPAVRNFKVANEELAGLFAAVNNPRSAVITVSAYEHARKLIEAADGPEAYQEVLMNIQRLAEREGVSIERLRSGQKPLPIEIPPISPERRASVPELVEKTKERTAQAVEGALPGSESRLEPSGVRIGATPDMTLKAFQQKLRSMLGPGWGVKELQ